MPRPRHTRREGVLLGLLVATSIWLWLAVVDAIAGQPFRTFAVLGGIVPFTLLHYALCLAYGLAAVAVVHGAAREPSLLLGASAFLFSLQLGFVTLTVIRSHTGLGPRAPRGERSTISGAPRRFPNGPSAAVPLPMGASYASPLSDRFDGPDRGNPGLEGGASGGHPGAQLPAARGPGRGRRRRRFAPHGATRHRAGRAGARHLRRALHGRDGGDREPREACAHPRSRRGVLAR